MMGKAKASSSAQRTLRQVQGRQPAGRGAHRPLRRARRLVRRRRAGVPLCQRLDLHHGRRLHGAVDHLLRPRAGRRPGTCRHAAPTACRQEVPAARLWSALSPLIPADHRGACKRVAVWPGPHPRHRPGRLRRRPSPSTPPSIPTSSSPMRDRRRRPRTWASTMPQMPWAGSGAPCSPACSTSGAASRPALRGRRQC